tara:strand:+ start:1881 stop:3332 length:1452 start_codon:yes stop_codon:yes gene_type:complete
VTKNKILIYLILLCSYSFFLGCSVVPSSGKNEFVLLSEEEEQGIGNREHPKIIEQFGGIYKNESLQNYVDSLGKFLVSTTETPKKKFTFTILNTPIINAFALPGGYIYLTRGLIYLCQNEAQLAGVIAHEIGHITGRHSAKRYTQAISTNLLANLLGTLTKNPLTNNLLNTSASLYLLSYSRKHEYEADKLATRYMVRAGFDPNEMANFLKVMENFSNLQKKISGNEKKISELLLTHPTSSKRVMEVINNSKEKVPYKPIIGREIFLKKIDGMLYGDKPENGFFFKNKFIHKPLDFSFDFDEVFYFLNYPKFLIGNSENQAKIIFTIDKNSGQDDAKYFSKWGKVSSKKIKDLKKNELLNGFLVSSCIIEKSDKILKLALIKDNKLFYKFSLIVDREKFDNFAVKFDNTIKSFKKVSDNPSLKNLNPPTIKILSNNEDFNNVKSNSLVSKINLQKKYSKEIFSAINHTEKNNEKGFKKLKVIY